MRFASAFCVPVFVLALSGHALAWGYLGHHMIGEVAAKNFPAELPAFLRTKDAVFQIGALSQEPDVSRNAGQPHDWDADPGHFLDLSDDGTILGGPKLSALPPSRRDYDSALRVVHSDQYSAGFLPYNIMDGWQQLVKDFALLRVYRSALKYGDRFKLTAADRRGYAQLVALREAITIRDLGWWAHFVEDASQPMHVSVHYNGWGEGPNPEGFVTGPGLHSKFEAAFVTANIREADVAALMKPYHHCDDTLAGCTQDYLAATARWTLPLYRLDKVGAFGLPTAQSKAFAAQRLADAANMLRDMVVDAWRGSALASLGYKEKTPVADYEAGKALMILQSKD
ncbi:MAG TPA: hypothetical protein VGM26_08595 [Rhizomicrobium sp.]|jgi:hypothetical protein